MLRNNRQLFFSTWAIIASACHTRSPAGHGDPAGDAGGSTGETDTQGSGGSAADGGGGSDAGATSSAGTNTAGSAGSGNPRIDHEKFVGNITTYNQVDIDGLRFADYWDQITPENAGKWGSVQASIDSNRDWTTLDTIYDYAIDNDLLFKEHTFVWGNQQPSGAIDARAVKSWMRDFCQRYPKTKLIDVVNEPPPHTTPSYVDAMGGGTDDDWRWIINAFAWARQSCPTAILILNDYSNIELENSRFIDIVETVQQGGGPIDALGAQAHGLDYEGITTDAMKRYIQKLHDETGLPIYITEYDISFSDDQQQLEHYREQIPFFLETDYIPGITIWGWIYGTTWSQSPDSGLVRDGEARPAMTWLMDTLGRPTP